MSDSKADAKLIDIKLREIVKCVVKHARKNPDLSKDLLEILYSKKIASTEELLENKNIINPIVTLQSKGNDILKQDLSLLTDSELIKVVKDNKYKIIIDPKKSINRDSLIMEIIDYVSNQLKKGSSFL